MSTKTANQILKFRPENYTKSEWIEELIRDSLEQKLLNKKDEMPDDHDKNGSLHKCSIAEFSLFSLNNGVLTGGVN